MRWHYVSVTGERDREKVHVVSRNSLKQKGKTNTKQKGETKIAKIAKIAKIGSGLEI